MGFHERRRIGDPMQIHLETKPQFIAFDALQGIAEGAASSQHNLVLLLGSPAAGKSTIGASLALGASDIWKCSTIKATSPEHLQAHLSGSGKQFFWIDDAWGSTQYQRERTESWNQVFPLMQGAMKRGTRFLITSRDYIWQSARKELKLQALPVLTKSQVVINVHELTVEEKARILYNHLKLGDQDEHFRKSIKPVLPSIAKRSDFLPETARRLGTKLFTENLLPIDSAVHDFFERPKEFLEQTIENLAPECRAAIALIFLNGGNEGIANVLRDEERDSILEEVATEVLGRIGSHVDRLRRNWESDYDPDEYFDSFRTSLRRFTDALSDRVDSQSVEISAETHIRSAVRQMEEDYVPDTHTVTPTQQSAAKADSLDELFRDVDE
jgi:Novel STAND NTPase 3